MAPGTPHMNLLGFHRIGAGKTITFLNCAERWLDKGKPLVILPASLIGGVRNELRGPFLKYLRQPMRDIKKLYINQMNLLIATMILCHTINLLPIIKI
jgi:SNF2 family DNA or RNA helicase